MKRFGIAILLLVVIAVIGYVQFVPKALDPRASLEKSVREMAVSKKLSKDEENLLRLQLAVIDYVGSHREPPDSLTQLVPTYFAEIPTDPKTKEPFKYVRDGRRYYIGEQVDEHNGMPAVQVAKNDQATPALPLNEDGFVNPNEMVQEDFVYDSTGKRDPFMPFDLSGKSNNGGGLLTPLENYSLGQLRLSAVLMEGKEPTAIVEDSVGKGYTVRPGTKIGNSGGVIVSIEPDRLKILETKMDFTGKEVQSVAELVLQKDSPSSDPKDREKRKAAEILKKKKARFATN